MNEGCLLILKFKSINKHTQNTDRRRTASNNPSPLRIETDTKTKKKYYLSISLALVYKCEWSGKMRMVAMVVKVMVRRRMDLFSKNNIFLSD